MSSAIFLIGEIISAIISMQHPDFVVTAWKSYLFTVALCTVCFIVNSWLAKYLPLLEGFVLCYMMTAFVSTIIVLLVLSPKLTSSEVFQSFASDLGRTEILELVANQVLMFYSLTGSDSTAHMVSPHTNNDFFRV
jgi:choline transport protein